MPRARLIASPEEYEKRLYAYFDKCAKDEQQPTYTGLILALGLVSRKNLSDYGKRDEYKDLVSLTRLMMEEQYEKIALTSNHSSGAIFALKNLGWKDKSETELYGKDGGDIKVSAIERKIVKA